MRTHEREVKFEGTHFRRTHMSFILLLVAGMGIAFGAAAAAAATEGLITTFVWCLHICVVSWCLSSLRLACLQPEQG